MYNNNPYACFPQEEMINQASYANVGNLNAAPSNEMQGAYEVSSAMLRDRMKNEDQGEENLQILDQMVADDIIVVPGTYDHIHNVLSALKMPFKIVEAYQIPQTTFRPDQTVYVNCASNFPEAAAIKLSGFVEAGGMLITTDWALKNVLEVGFPGTVKYNNKATPDCVVGIELIDKEDEVVKGFMDEDKDAKPQWWLESSSYPIEVLDHERVKVLVRSEELGKQYGADPVIVRITWGKGVVYHMISHFYLQRSETKNMKQTTNAANYMQTKGVSMETISEVNSNANYANLNYAQVQSAYTSTDFVSRAAIKQKKKFQQ
jgi:hypothetical protein